jgi:hypothetical protein
MLRTLLADEFRFLTFRPVSGAVRDHRTAYLAFGLACAWLAGVGRYWDNPRADWWQHAGLGSVTYVFVLSGLLWALVQPLRPENGSFANVLCFVSLTAPPAMLYAVPVERFLSLEEAREANVWFLAVVAAWRVALWAFFLRRTLRLGRLDAAIATLLPLCVVVIALSLLNLEHVVFRLMGGLRPGEEGPDDDAYGVVVLLSWLAWLVGPIAGFAFLLRAAGMGGARR